MKYPEAQSVEAEYAPCSSHNQNPFLEAMPDMLGKEELFERVKSFPPQQDTIGLSAAQRRQLIPSISSFFLPMNYMYRLYDSVYRAIETTYMTMNTLEATRQLNTLFCSTAGELPRCGYITQAECGSVLGVPGVGKTSTLRRCLNMMPQVIGHTEYRGKVFFCKQITYLFVECPSDCSVKTLALNVVSAIDAAIGSNYFERLSASRGSNSALALHVKQLCINHHVGILIIDEIQNAIQTAQTNRQSNKLIKFLTELMNETCTAVFLVGTLEAEELFLQEEYLKRRTRGARLLPLTPGAEYRRFIESLWPYQFTRKKSSLTDKIANVLYDYSSGVPAYIVKIFEETQVQAIMSGNEEITERTIVATVGTLAIHVPKAYTSGTSISGYVVDEEDYRKITDEQEPVKLGKQNRRGRRAQKRDEKDLLMLVQETENVDEILNVLLSLNLLEVV